MQNSLLCFSHSSAQLKHASIHNWRVCEKNSDLFSPNVTVSSQIAAQSKQIFAQCFMLFSELHAAAHDLHVIAHSRKDSITWCRFAFISQKVLKDMPVALYCKMRTIWLFAYSSMEG